MTHIRRYGLLQGICLCIFMLFFSVNGLCQPGVKNYTIKNGNEIIELSKKLPEKEIDDFIKNFDLGDLDLKTFIKTNNPDSLKKKGWSVFVNNNSFFVLTRPLNPADLNDLLLEKIHFDKFIFGEEISNTAAVRYGSNKFKNKYPFRVKDSIVVFFLKNNRSAKNVLLAASFTDWQNNAVPMILTDSGWIAYIKVAPGKYWYKFIVDGDWKIDNDNQLNENDGEGNINSVYYKTNYTFKLNGYPDAKKVFLAGSFNNWRNKELAMTRTEDGWELPVLLPEGTHTYKFVIDGDWRADATNPDKLPDGHGAYNSVIRFGGTHTFKLNGYLNAKQVILSGSFNGWKEDELFMIKTATGWELPYVLGPGNYEYKFIVDKKWMADPNNAAKGNDGNSFLVVAPNYKFKLYAPDAKQVMLAGDFNGWNPYSVPMKKEGDAWVFNLHLAPGKHRYKFVVDGEWIKDPENKLWEQNEYGTGNSIIWITQK